MRLLNTITNFSTCNLKNFDYLLKKDIILQHNRNNEKEILIRQLKSLNILKEIRAKDYLKMEAGKDKNPNTKKQNQKIKKKLSMHFLNIIFQTNMIKNLG